MKIEDWYRRKAAGMFGVPYDEVTKEQRTAAKRKHWLSHYSVGPVSLPKIIQDNERNGTD